jgi:hypothetical protein
MSWLVRHWHDQPCDSGLIKKIHDGSVGSARCQRGCKSTGGVLAPTNLEGWLPLTVPRFLEDLR